MTLSLTPELEQRVEQEIASGEFQNSNQLIEEAVSEFLQKRQSLRRRKALDNIASAVHAAGLRDIDYHIPPAEDD